jgi:hypothetical protein
VLPAFRRGVRLCYIVLTRRELAADFTDLDETCRRKPDAQLTLADSLILEIMDSG